MARETKGPEQFDVDGLRQLLELMEKFDVREFKQERGDTRYILRRGDQFVAGPAPVAAYAPAPVAPQAAAAAPASAAPAAAAPVAEDNLIKVTSPTVGTFYQSPSPTDPAFVKVGDNVSPDTVVCIVEAMKLFNKIPAKVSGTIVKVLLKDGDPVEFGQALFLVKP